jgi:hypothetical protein
VYDLQAAGAQREKLPNQRRRRCGMTFFSTEEMFICRECGHWWTQEASFFGTYKENPEHTCEACGGEGEEASEEMKNFILPAADTTDYTGNAAMFEAEIMAAEKEHDAETDADAEAGADADADAAGAEM